MQKKTATKPRKERDAPVRITDTTLRDAHQSLWATRMRTRDIVKIIDVVDNVGFYSLEVWGGATFDVCLRFLRENPWERLRQIKAGARKTPLQMLLRGQNVVGYRNYPDDVVDRFIALACENGVDIFRVFDALNDVRNLEYAIRAVKRYGGHAQGTLSYTISPVHTVEAFVQAARDQVAIGIDSLCIKDMAGILSPVAAEKLIGALVKELKIPIQVHSHATSGMAVASYFTAVQAGAGAIDCAIAPMSGFSSQPPVDTMIAMFDETSHRVSFDMDALKRVTRYFAELAPERQLSQHQANCIIDPEVLQHHIPGGMISNLRSQLAQQDALNRIEEVFEELPRTRADLGFPPLVTPTSQIIGIQAVMNVLSGERYKMVPQEIKDYVKGLYGRPPAPINPKVRKAILGGQKPITCRPADLIDPMLPTATHDVDPDLIQGEEDIISYCMFPEVALDFFKWRKLPVEDRPTAPADLELRRARQPKEPAAPVPAPTPPRPLLGQEDYQSLNGLLDRVRELNLAEITIRRRDLSLSVKSEGLAASLQETNIQEEEDEPDAKTAPKPIAPPAETAAPAPQPAAQEPPAHTVKAPLAGTFYASAGPGKPRFVKEGDAVKTGQVVCVVEAMKLFNEIKADKDGRIDRILVEHGEAVAKDQPLIAIAD